MKKYLLIAMALMLCSGAWAANHKSQKVFEVTGNTLADICQKTSGYDYGVCLGFINGVAALQHSACIPDGVKFGQLKDVVLKYIQENPEIRHKPATGIITKALKQVWVCK